MNILFLSISQAISNLTNRGIYPDLLRKFAEEGHNLYIVCPAERRRNVKTSTTKHDNVTTLVVQTLNITKTHIIEKGISTLSIGFLYRMAIQKYLSEVKFDLILYATPPITFNGLIYWLKKKNKASTYLLLKDIFPQNALDIGMLSKWNPIYHSFRAKEKSLYNVSDFIGCMSPANVNYLIENNPYLLPQKLEVCPNSITICDTDKEPDRIGIRNKYNIPQQKLTFIYGGNLGKPQGIDFLIEVLSSNRKNDDAFFVIAGSGTEAYKIKNFIAYEKPTNIIVLPQMPRIEFDQLLSACDVGLIFLDKRYTIPNYPSRLLNYLEFKKPVLMAIDLSTDVGPIAEENKYGFWAESGDLSNFNQKLRMFLDKPNLIDEMGENGYNFLLENYTVEKSYNTIMSHFI